MMIFVLSIISGIKDYDTVYELCVLNAVLMSLGYFLEQGVNKEVKIVALVIGFLIVVAIFVTQLVKLCFGAYVSVVAFFWRSSCS